MRCTVSTDFDTRESSDVLIVPFWKGKKAPEIASSYGDRLKSAYLPPINAHDFTAKEDEGVIVYSNLPYEKRLLLLGLGDKKHCTAEKLRRAYGTACKMCRKKKAEAISILFPEIDQFEPEMTLSSILEGIGLTNYSFDILKHDSLTENTPTLISTCEFIIPFEELPKKEAISVIDDTKSIMQGVYLARDLTNGNACDITPTYLGTVAKQLGKKYPKIKVAVHDQKWIEKQGMGLFLAVSQGAATPPVFIVAEYRGNPKSQDKTVIVGKGVTFDTGGLHLKPMGGMETQKADMGGAAVALGTLKAVADLQLPVNLSVVVASCENAIGSKAYKPGDVFKGASGTTVEITNTDAEGRLTLADALYYTTQHLKPSRIIDFATLTGSMVVALGHVMHGLMSNSDLLAKELVQAGEKTFERTLQFPLYEEYKEEMKSDIADLKNAASREGGAILAGIFLQEFVGNTPWAHFDIAGVAFAKEARRYQPKYATGIGVRLMVEFLRKLSEGARKLSATK